MTKISREEEGLEEAKWLVVKAMLDKYPKLRGRVKRYLEEGIGA